MEDLQKIQEFFSKPLDENRKLTFNDFVRMVRDDMMAGAAPDERPSEELVAKRAKAYYNEYLQGASLDDIFENVEEGINDFSPMSYAKKVANGEMSIEAAMEETGFPYIKLVAMAKTINPKFSPKITEEEVNVSNDIPDIIAVDVPLFIRLLEFAREDAGDDMDLHEVAERAIEAVKSRGVLSMDDYDTLVPPKEELDEKMLVPKDKIDRMARDIASKFFTSKADKGEAIEILKKAVRDVYKNLDPEAEIQEVEGYSKYLKDDPEFPDGKTKGLTPDVMNKILMKIVQDIDETKQLGENLNEELCPKGKAYLKKRMAAGEKSSAYLSGRAVKVCKGQMKG